jgi:chloramphenicol 3-O-phosphotransferase
MIEMQADLLIGVVGPCSSGKSELARRLRRAGYHVKEIRQEHSGVPTLWQRFNKPDMLIYLDVDQEIAAQREGLSKPSSWWDEEREVRLAHARRHADLYIDTSDVTPDEVFAEVEVYLEKRRHAI